MANRLVDTEIWKKDWFLDLNTKQKLLVKFLFDNCDCAGFYKISWHLLKLYFSDTEITKEDFEKIKQVKFIENDLIFIEDFALFQCKVNSFKELNPKNNAHLGVLKLLKKHNIFLSPSLGASEPLASPYAGAQEKEKEKEKEKDKDISLNKQIDTININSENKNFSKKSDPYINPIADFYKQKYKEIMGVACYLNNDHRNKIVELASDIDDFKETIPTVLQKLKVLKFDDIDFKPSSTWLLKNDNYIRMLEGVYDKERKLTNDEIFEKIRLKRIAEGKENAD